MTRKLQEAHDGKQFQCRCSAVAALSAVLQLLPAELRRGRALPFVRGLCAADCAADPEVQQCVARLMGGTFINVIICLFPLGHFRLYVLSSYWLPE